MILHLSLTASNYCSKECTTYLLEVEVHPVGEEALGMLVCILHKGMDKGYNHSTDSTDNTADMAAFVADHLPQYC